MANTNGTSAHTPASAPAKKDKTPALLASGFSVSTDKTRTVEVPGGQIVINETTGAEHWIGADGERMEIKPANVIAAPAPPKEIVGKLVTGKDGVRRFVPDDETDGEPLDLTKSLEERDAEAKLSPLRKAVRDIERKRVEELKAIELIATDADKVVSLNMLVEQLQKEREMLTGLKARYEMTIMGQSILLAQAQFPNQQ